MIEYLQILGQEVYKVIFLLVPILVSVAMIVWLDRRVGIGTKEEGTKCCWSVWAFFKLLQMH